MKIFKALLISISVFLIAGCTDNNDIPNDVKTFFKQSVMNIDIPKGGGTGTFITPDIVLTNCHVIKAKKTAILSTYDKALTFTGEVIACDKEKDLALIRCDCKDYLPFIIPITSKVPELGTYVYSGGYGVTNILGILDGFIQGQSTVGHYQISVPIAPGDSGSPVIAYINNQLKIVGVRSSVMALEYYVQGIFNTQTIRVLVTHIGLAINTDLVTTFLKQNNILDTTGEDNV